MARRHRRRHYRRAISRAFRRRPKPALAVLAGALVGPALVIGGTQGQLPMWKDMRLEEAVNRLGIVYAGYSTQSHAQLTFGNYGAYMGTAALVAGAAIHWVASKVGLNRALSSARVPFRI